MEIKVYHTLHEDAVRSEQKYLWKNRAFMMNLTRRTKPPFILSCTLTKKPAATCRFNPGQVQGEYLIGRIAVEKEFRGKHLGSRILSAAESEIRNSGGSTVRLHAQQQARQFYEKQGYSAFGEPDFDEDCPISG